VACTSTEPTSIPTPSPTPTPITLVAFLELNPDAISLDEAFREVMEFLQGGIGRTLQAFADPEKWSASEWLLLIDGPDGLKVSQLLGEFLVKAGQIGAEWIEGRKFSAIKDREKHEAAVSVWELSWEAYEIAGRHRLVAIALKDKAEFVNFQIQARLALVGLATLSAAIEQIGDAN